MKGPLRNTIGLCLALSAGCATTVEGRLVDVHQVIDATSRTVVSGLHQTCLALRDRCVSEDRFRVSDCPEWQRCDAARSAWVQAIRAAESALLAAQEAHDAIDEVRQLAKEASDAE